MTLKRIADTLTIAGAAFIIYIGLNFLIDPVTTVTGFGLPESSQPGGDAAAIMNVKGERDIVMGVLGVVLLIARQRTALGWLLVAMALAPVGDAVIVLSYGGSVAVAIGVHLATAAVVALTGVLQLRVAASQRTAAAVLPASAV